MKLSGIAGFGLLFSMTVAHAQARAPQPAPRPQPPPPVYSGPVSPGTAAPVYVYDQKPVSGRTYLISPEQAQSIINRFKEEYKKLGAPRFLIYVNRELIDEGAGLKLSSQKRVVETSRIVDHKETGPGAVSQSERAASTNLYRLRDPKELSLSDKQTMRDVERLFGRPLRMAGVHLADQRVATQLMSGKSLESFIVHSEGEQARKEREALSKIADVVLEILISSKEATVAEISGDRTYRVPDIQATAIRMSDAKILGQATAADLIGQAGSAGDAARTFGVREISEATALSLMEDLMLQ